MNNRIVEGRSVYTWNYGFDIEKVLHEGRYEDDDESEEDDEDDKKKGKKKKGTKKKEKDIVLDKFETDKVLKKIPKHVKWLTIEPGRQFIGKSNVYYHSL